MYVLPLLATQAKISLCPQSAIFVAHGRTRVGAEIINCLPLAF